MVRRPRPIDAPHETASSAVGSRDGAWQPFVQSTRTRIERAKLLTTHAKLRSSSISLVLSLSLSLFLSFSLACVCPVSLEGPEKQNSRGEKGEYGGVCLLVGALLGWAFFARSRRGRMDQTEESLSRLLSSLRAALLWPNKVRVALSFSRVRCLSFSLYNSAATISVTASRWGILFYRFQDAF